MNRLLFVIWIATIGADRIDFACGNLDFKITPFIAISPIIVIGYFLKSFSNYKILTLKLIDFYKLNWFYAFISIYILIAAISVLFGNDFLLGSKRLLLLVYQIFFVILIVQLFYNYRIKAMIVRGSQLGIAVFLIFNSLLILCFISTHFAQMMNTVQFINLNLHSSGGIAARFSGASLDPNRGGLILLFYFSSISIFGKPTRINRIFMSIAFILIIVTFSRSAIISFALFLILSVVMIPKIKIRKAIYYIIPITLCIFLLWEFLTCDLGMDMFFLLGERLSISEGYSGGEHLALMFKGLEILSESIKVLLVGIGFGTSYTVLGDFFDTKYANFHSLYLTLLIETGIGGLLTMLILFLMPMFFNNCYIPIMISLLFFNVFYQSVLEPITWMIVMLGWLKLYSLQNRGSVKLLPSKT